MVEENANININQAQNFRPKLRKIKRPKQRIAAEGSIPTPPLKVSLDEMISDTNNEAVNNEEERNQSDNSLIISDGDRGISNVSDGDNSYVLDGLPPELNYVADEYIDDYSINNKYVKKNVVVIFALLFMFIGIFVGKTIFSSQKIETHGLEGVVVNPDIPSGRPRCGLTAKNQACVFYLMNWYRQELNGRDFYKMAADLTGREKYMIESDNLRYANIKIKPGHFAQLNIPALK
jgi:hypothetical protein